MKKAISGIIVFVCVALALLFIIDPTFKSQFNKEFQCVEIYPADANHAEEVTVVFQGEYSFSIFQKGGNFSGKIIVENHPITEKLQLRRPLSSVGTKQADGIEYFDNGNYILFGDIFSTGKFENFFISVLDQNEDGGAGWDQFNSKYIVTAKSRDDAIKIIEKLNPHIAGFFK